MKIKTLSQGLVIAISLGVVLLGVIAYAATSNIFPKEPSRIQNSSALSR